MAAISTSPLPIVGSLPLAGRRTDGSACLTASLGLLCSISTRKRGPPAGASFSAGTSSHTSSSPRWMWWRVCSNSAGRLKPLSAAGRENSVVNCSFTLPRLDAVLRPLRAGQAGSDVAQVQAHHLRIIDLAGLRHAEQALGAEIRLEGLDLGLGAARALEVVDGLLVHREEAHGGTVLGCHVADGRPVRQRQGARALAEELHELAHHLVAAQDFGHRQHQVGGRHALAQLARRSKPTTSGVRKYTGCPSIAASASMPPTPQATTPMPLIMVVWLSVPTRVSG